MLSIMTGVSVETHAARAVRLTKTYGHGRRPCARSTT